PANVSQFPSASRRAKLRAAAFLSASAVGVRAIPDRPRKLATEPQWKPLATVAPSQPAGKIIPVLVSFLRRPIRIACHDGLPESFEIRFQPVSFPQYAPRMGVLEDRIHRTDRLGFTPP